MKYDAQRMDGLTASRVDPLEPELSSIDLFAGGGGASEGIRLALGRAPVVAVNHDPAAIAMHAENHPGTLHLCESIFEVEPFRPGGRSVDLLWASPDCKHFSRAKGGKPRDKKIRALAWIVVDWARVATPTVICLENVPEFEKWGPLDDKGHPIKSKRGETFLRFVRALESEGYRVEWRVLNAADYGAPTSRKRLFMIARCDGRQIVWPEPSHGPDRPRPYRTAAECIDWSIACPSIFERKRPLAEATQRRIAEGIRRFVLDHSSPFIVNLTHGGRLEPLDEPMRTVTAAHRGEKALVTPVLASIDHQSSSSRSTTHSPGSPLSTITVKNRHVLVAPTLIQTGYGERKGQAPRVLDLQAPLGTIVSGGCKHGLVAAHLVQHYGRSQWQHPETPLNTVTAVNHHSVVAAHITKFYGTSVGSDLSQPMPTITSGGQHLGLVQAFLTKHLGDLGFEEGAPVTVEIDGGIWAIADIGMRMLQPRELARAQGFSDDYILSGTKTRKVALIGNSVPPPVVAAIVRSQFLGLDSAPVSMVA